MSVRKLVVVVVIVLSILLRMFSPTPFHTISTRADDEGNSTLLQQAFHPAFLHLAASGTATHHYTPAKDKRTKWRRDVEKENIGSKDGKGEAEHNKGKRE